MNHDDHTHCSACGAKNPLGSRFCNSCGQPLPDTDEIVCTNCHTHNPKTNIYCDNCGVRLVPQSVEPKSDESDNLLPPAPSTSMFNLPIRDEGETGDFDLNDLPNWLRTGDMPTADDAAEPPQKLPRPSELTPEERPETADLPDWLLQETSSDNPIIDTPPDISTEQFLDLMGSDEDAEGVDELGLFAEDDPRLDSDPSTLPNWLQDSIADQPPPTPASSDEQDVPEWLAKPNLLGNRDEEEEEYRGETDFLASELADWMSNDYDDVSIDSETAVPLDEETDFSWLDEEDEGDASPSQTAEPSDDLSWLSEGTSFFDDPSTPSDRADESTPDDSGDDLSWLSEGTSFFDDPSTPSDTPADDTPDDDNDLSWLNQGTSLFGESDAPADAAAEDSLVDDGDDLSWLNEGTGLFGSEPAANESASAQESEPGFDWLSELEGDGGMETAASEAEDPMDAWLLDSQDERLNEASEADMGETFSEGFDWLNELEEDEAEIDEVESAAAVESTSNWLTEESEKEPTTVGDGGDDFDWLDELEETIAEDQGAEDSFALTIDENDDSGNDWLDDLAETPDVDTLSDFPEKVEGVEDWLGTLEESETAVSAEDEALEMPEIVTGELPDWLSELGAPDTGSLGELEDEEIEETFSDFFTDDLTENEVLPDWLATDDAPASSIGELPESGPLMANLDWLQDEGSSDHAVEETAASTPPTPDLPAEEPLTDESWMTADASSLEAEPDWLSALEGLDESVFDPDLEAALEADELPLLEEPDPVASEPHALAYDFSQSDSGSDADLEEADDSWMTASNIGDELSKSDLPDWLSELGDVDSDADSSSDLVGDQLDLPDWINTMKPGETPQPSQYESIFSDEDDFGDIDGSDLTLDENFGDSDTLPDWLQPASASADGFSTEPTNGRLPSQDLLDTDPFGDDGEMAESISAELTSLLEDSPPPPPIEKAEIPEWVQALKPANMDGSGAGAGDKPIQRTGPLAGIRGVVAIEPDIAMPRSSEIPLAELAVNAEQQQQVALIRQLKQVEALPIPVGEKDKATTASQTLRLVVTLLLLATITAVLLGLLRLPMQPPALNPIGEAGLDALDDAAGQSVLVVFDYPPAYAGELNPLTETLLQRAVDNGSDLLSISQQPAGTGLAAEKVADFEMTPLGLLPGGAVGLRQLATCLDAQAACPLLLQTISGEETSSGLDQVGLILVLTSDRESLINWIEQVGTTVDVPLVAGTTQALQPLAAPYLSSEQLAGGWFGLADTVSLQTAVEAPNEGAQQLLAGQTAAQLVAIIIILVGLLFFGVQRSTSGGRR